MKILICSNGMPAADNAVRLGGLLASAAKAETTLFGIAEKPADESPLRAALENEANQLRALGVLPKIVVSGGDPIRQIVAQTSSGTDYDLAIIGAEHKGRTGPYWRSRRTYEVVKAVAPPVLVAMGECDRLKSFLVCTGGKKYIGEAVLLTGHLAAAVGASVTLLHVMAEPPVMYADLVRLEEDLDRLMGSNSELAVNLSRQKKDLENLGVRTEVRIRHGLVLEQVLREAQQGSHDLIVTGSPQARGLVRHYIMGDLTRSILNRAGCPVLVARSKPSLENGNIFRSLKRLFVVPRS
jgi:nucleotide-binding universal stress UspA family protein